MILQINKMYSPEIGGVETVVQKYANYLKNYDDVIVLCIKKDFSLRTTTEYIDGVKVYRCASFGTYMSMPVSIVFFFYLFFLSRKAEFIHFHEPFPLGTLGSLLVPKSKTIFVTWHSDIIKQKSIKKIFEFFQQKLCKKANKITTTSKNMISFSPTLQKFETKTDVLPLSIDVQEYGMAEDVLIEGLPQNYVLFLGRFSYYKGIFILLEAVENMENDIPFVIVGDGELKDEIRSRIEKISKNIILIDRYVSDQEKKFLLQNSKLMVFPSIYPSEAFGIIQLESMVYGKPVINTKLPTGVPWVSIDQESGLSVSVNNAKELANAIEKLYFNKKLYDHLSSGAKRRVLKLFSDDVVNSKLHQLYFGN